ncbi:SMI1/KNR4 family protein [Deinococcus caeni]|uniref:SMI1/KNR4 family protein n=1 Tax=Deinococcus caeni TaxID=569127 RepID=UPI003617CBF0
MSLPAFVQALDQSLPTLRASLRGPAAPGDLQALPPLLGTPLPPGVQDLYATVDGQDPQRPGVLFGLTWLSARQAAQEHATWMDLAADDTSLLSEPAGAIRAGTFHPAWLPLATDGSGNGLATDLAPGETGAAGQVITYGPDETTRRVVSPNVQAFFGWAAQAVTRGDLRLDGDVVTYRGQGRSWTPCGPCRCPCRDRGPPGSPAPYTQALLISQLTICWRYAVPFAPP